jgi:hypothetical protein|tara:strand:+ start:32 stop:220 length:189 start_codon:yes stop_codon:yes gene_type:complete
MKNQEQVFLHLTMNADLAYQFSFNNSDVANMQMVLRAYKEDYSFEAAKKQIEVAREFEKLAA